MKHKTQKSEKYAIVTGGSRGIGYAIAKELIQKGYHVVICARDVGRLKKAANELSGFGKVQYAEVDLSNRKSIAAFVRKWHKPLHTLVNNAGIIGEEHLLQKENGIWERVLATNLNGVYYLTKGLARHIEKNGRIVNISSQLGKEGRAGWGAYCASKFGLIGLTKCWAKELGSKGITVNAVCPGWVATDMALKDIILRAQKAGISKEEFVKRECKHLELKRFTKPEEVASLVYFLISPEGSGITGRAWLMNAITG